MAKFPARLPRSREPPSQPALSDEHIENFTKDSGKVRSRIVLTRTPAHPAGPSGLKEHAALRHLEPTMLQGDFDSEAEMIFQHGDFEEREHLQSTKLGKCGKKMHCSYLSIWWYIYFAITLYICHVDSKWFLLVWINFRMDKLFTCIVSW